MPVWWDVMPGWMPWALAVAGGFLGGWLVGVWCGEWMGRSDRALLRRSLSESDAAVRHLYLQLERVKEAVIELGTDGGHHDAA